MSGGWQRVGRGKAGAADDDATASASARLERPLGQGDALAREVAAARRLRLPHALIVEGLRGGGKSVVMRWLAAALLCPSELDEDEPCGGCRTCARVASEQHPDLHVLHRARDEDDVKEHKLSYYVIKVDQIRAAQETLARHAVEGRARVLLIADADAMEEEAQNALLKTLEEPGVATFLLLEATRPEQLLSTVRSRARRLRVLPLPEATLRSEFFRRLPAAADRLETALPLARGSLGLLLAAVTEQTVQLHDLVRQVLDARNRLRPIQIARQVLHGVTERRLEMVAARTFLWLLRAELQHRLSALADAADDSYGGPSAEPWTTWLEHTLTAERDLQLQIPPEQTLAACLVAFRRG
jgi:DNA polymerase III delta' subunit